MNDIDKETEIIEMTNSLYELKQDGFVEHRINSQTGADEWKLTEKGKREAKELGKELGL